MSARRPRTSTRRHVKARENFTDREEDGSEKCKQKKRKLSDLLGPPWSEEDLKHFYQSYRRHGKDWKKVAASFQNRTIEMVEVLYKMNKAYLSLPEGTASAAGLIAMMTDHYNMLEENQSLDDDDESSKDIAGSGPSSQVALRPRNVSSTIQSGTRSKFLPQMSGMSSYGGPSPVKKPRTVAVNRPRAVGKRTPRFPVMHSQDKRGSAKFPFAKPVEDAEQDSFGECDELKVALTLAASASRRAASPQISRTPTSRTFGMRNSHAQNGHNKHLVPAASESSGTKHSSSNMDDPQDGGSEESRDTENGVVAKTNSIISDVPRKTVYDGEGNSRLRRITKSQFGKRETVRFDELKEECSCTEEGTMKQEYVKVGDGLKSEQASKRKRALSQKSKQRSRQLFSGDEKSGLHTLATLAETLNGLLPSPTLDSGPGNYSDLNKDIGSETVVWSAREDLALQMEGASKGVSNTNAKGGSIGRSRDYCARYNSASNFDSDFQKVAEYRKKKRKVMPDKRDQLSGGNGELEEKVLNHHAEEPVIHMKEKQTLSSQALSKYVGKLVKQEKDQELERQEIIVGRSEVIKTSVLDIQDGSLKKRNQRKRKLLKDSERREISHCPHASVAEEMSSDQVRLIHCLSSEKVRRWCIYEWFYSAIDLHWFAQNEFVEYLNHAGLGHVPRLTRAEWGVIRGSLGKPRRLSKRFLIEEREKLEAYRDSVRKHYQDRNGGPSIDLPRPLTVSQRVIARHPKTKELYNGSILTVDRNKCRVQFDHPELGVELVSDIDCMPIGNSDDLSDTLMSKNMQSGAVCQDAEDIKCGIRPWITGTAGLAARSSLNERLDKTVGVDASNSSSLLLNALCKQAQAADTVDSVMQVKMATNEAVAAAQQAMYSQSCSLAQVQAKEADIRALADLTRALDKKEAILKELKNMNDDADTNQRDGDLRISDMFQKHYATLLLQLKEVNQQVCGALSHLRQRNKYQENCMPPWQRSAAPTGNMNSCNVETNILSLEHFPLAREVTLNARQQAKLMVNTAMDAMLSTKEGEDALSKIGMALNRLPKANLYAENGKIEPSMPTLSQVNSGFGTSTDSRNMDSVNGGTKASNGKDPNFLSDLMSTCVATLLMVQAFTERQFPPAEVAMAFDSVLSNLRPCSSQNNPIYSEIQYYASLLKNQIIALIPTQSLPPDCQLPH